MKALVIEKPFQAAVKEVPYPQPGANEVTIKVKQVGICGTDVHIYRGEFLSPYPIIPGHEFSGIIDAVGENVTDFKVGDRVSADPSLFCGECEYCLTNRGNHCANWGALGNTVDGTMAEYVSVPAGNVVHLPDTMSFEQGAFIEPMACVVHAMNRLQLHVGDRVLLFGAGAMGQQLVQSLKQAGASELVVVDLSQQKLDLALEMGATLGVLSEQIEEKLSTSEYEKGFDVVVDATGIPAVIEQAMHYIGPAGKYLQFGVTPQHVEVRIDPFKLYNKDWTLLGSMAINHTFIPAFHWLKERRINVQPLVSKTLELEEVIDYLSGKTKDPNGLKVQIKL
ncbi:alcohol dehydrogenase [Pullulanibacillus camelliae]|uniref:Alcohol dehydrogenase n=1 Tax=Pullulanibacillus camelliae TaxID=1707096 RepID=A0A8J2VFG9_9BACL|nr:zinc-dependent alcohol dehydrogenase family protein [Pullulanibacillus camelliae]GGE29594.1 alcohol dehydrogenase [Pullulanibacillus camelliae]